MNNKERSREHYKKNKLRYLLRNIKSRCENVNDRCYNVYGGKGVKCLITLDELKELWVRDRANKLNWASIDRKDPDGNYEYSNCRFIEMSDNAKKEHLKYYKKL